MRTDSIFQDRFQISGLERTGLAILLLVASLAGGMPPVDALAQAGEGLASFTAGVGGNQPEAANRLPLELVVPQNAQVGERVTFTLYGRGVSDLAGFESALRYDPNGLDFASAELAPELQSQGTLLSMGPVENNGTVHLGAASCPVVDCSQVNDYLGASRKPAAVTGNLPLANFSFYVRAPGSYHIQVEGLKLFSADGTALYGVGGAAQPAAGVALERLDATGNSFINDSDAYALLMMWDSLVRQGQCINEQSAAYDLDGSGCLDAADLQVVLAHWGEEVHPQAAPFRTEGQEVSPEATTATFIVDSSGDEPDANPGNGQCRTSGGRCTLRAALMEANERPGADTIQFNIRSAGGGCPNVVTISASSTLTIDDRDDEGITIDGYTQCGASANSGAVAGNAVIKIEIKGTKTPGTSGLKIYSGNNLVRGLAIYHFSDNLVLSGRRAQNNRIEGNFVGTNAAQTERTFIENDQSDGILAGWGAHDNRIGGVGPEKRNIISGNDQDGLGLQGVGTTGNIVYNNYIGVKQDGLTPFGNNSDGIDMAEGATSNTIGGLQVGQRNVISGNHNDGVEISHTEDTRNNQVVGNFLGLAADGMNAAGNGERGVTFEDIVNGNLISRNVIVANGGHGVRFYTSNDNELSENFIGARPPGLGANAVVPAPSSVNIAHLVAMPNGQRPEKQAGLSGILFTGGSQRNLIQKNIIANHPEYGIVADVNKGYLADGSCNTFFNTFSQNQIMNNGRQGIHLKAGQCDNGQVTPNQGIQPPAITQASVREVRGTACANCMVELFITDKTSLNPSNGENAGEARQYVTRGTANGSGAFRIQVNGGIAGVITATATDGNGNTSQFATNVYISLASGGGGLRLYLPLLKGR